MRCGFHFRNALVENFHPKEENIKQTQEIETLENPDASNSEPTPRTPGPKGPPPPQIKDTPPEEFREATSRLDDGTSNGELEEEDFPTLWFIIGFIICLVVVFGVGRSPHPGLGGFGRFSFGSITFVGMMYILWNALNDWRLDKEMENSGDEIAIQERRAKVAAKMKKESIAILFVMFLIFFLQSLAAVSWNLDTLLYGAPCC
jgi:hypothetical protein